MNITKQRKRKQRPSDPRRRFWLAFKERIRRRSKASMWTNRRKIPDTPGQTVKFRRFQPYVIGESARHGAKQQHAVDNSQQI